MIGETLAPDGAGRRLRGAVAGDQLTGKHQQALQPWADGQMDYVIAITPHLVTGLRLVGWCR
jgi:hypothetical protein